VKLISSFANIKLRSLVLFFWLYGVVLFVKFGVSRFFLVNLRLELVDDAEQVELGHIVLELIVLVLELPLQTLDVQLR
jgi:hypothetical protein